MTNQLLYLDQLYKPKAFSNNNQDRKGAKTAPIDSNFVSNYFIFFFRISI